jgi:hypothetical protein
MSDADRLLDEDVALVREALDELETWLYGRCVDADEEAEAREDVDRARAAFTRILNRAKQAVPA